MPLLEIPLELLEAVWSHLEKERDMNAFVQTCRALHCIFNSPLYRHEALHPYPYALNWAALRGQTGTIQKLIAAGADIDTNKPNSPLCIAANRGDIDITRLLLRNGADTNVEDDIGRTPLVLAAARGHNTIVKMLLGAKAAIATGNEHRRDALVAACKYGHEDVALTLLEYGGIRTDRKSGLDSLTCAIWTGHTDMVRIILGATKDKVSSEEYLEELRNRAMKHAISSNHLEIVTLLLEEGMGIDDGDNDAVTPLARAIMEGRAEIVKFLLDHGASVKYILRGDMMPLARAASRGYTEVVRLIVKENVPVNYVEAASGHTPLALAAWKGDEETISILLNAGADPNIPGYNHHTALYRAVAGRHHEIAKMLLQNKANPNIPAMDGNTPLLRAAKAGRRKLVETLLDYGAILDAKCECGYTALIRASQFGHEEVTGFLLECGADIEARTDDGATALSVAAKRGHLAIVRVLLEKGANPGCQDRHGYTPLSHSVQLGYTNVVLVLLSAGLQYLDTPDLYTRTPLFFATIHGYVDIVRILLSKGSTAKATFALSGRSPISFANQYRQRQFNDRRDGALQVIWENFSDPSTVNIGWENMDETDSRPDKSDYRPECELCNTAVSEYEDYFVCNICGQLGFTLCGDCVARQEYCFNPTHILARVTPSFWNFHDLF